ncbi:relaxase/mobilization nuclease domain-containing protein [uncultured Bacteroides sp.]|uniref:relaxase/mobilization nuclease domain-containing protein n=1 Tax=uncultured Bacteroides sp. TaxID=162156 RepID=UPI002597DC41|nr:relaxase/mobilization nuclease domain-containing protein [uncultured Bacteroides sp.]
MVGKVISGSSFSGTVGYVMKEESRILEAEGVMPPEIKDMVQDFKDQTMLNPRLKNTVGHISLSFSPKDALRMTDALMTQIAKEYMQKMGITDTQYLLVRHLDQPHPHCHLVYNRVGNHGQTISDRNIKLRNAKVCRELTERFGLHLAPGKEDVRRERLREPDRTRYEIYDAIKECLPKCRNWNELEGKLKEQGINVRYKYCGSTNQKQGVLFSKNGLEFSSSKVDRAFSFSKLDRHFGQVQQRHTTLMSGIKAAAGSFRTAFAGLFGGGRSFSAAGGGGGGGSRGAGSVSLGSAGSIPLPPLDSPFALSPEMMQWREGESPEEHIARITALINKAAEAMAVALMERKRRMKVRSRKIG